MSTYKTAEEFITAIRALLLEGDFYAAQKLSCQLLRAEAAQLEPPKA